MPPVKPPPPPINSVLVKIAKDIATNGWTAVGVGPTFEHPGTPFTYTVGLYRSYDHPELVLTGINPTEGHAVLSLLVEKIQAGEKFEADKLYPDLFAGHAGDFNGWFKTILDANRDEYLTIARRWNGHLAEPGEAEYVDLINGAQPVVHEDFPALQAIFPDPLNRFPWDEGYNNGRWVQPLMDERVQL